MSWLCLTWCSLGLGATGALLPPSAHHALLLLAARVRPQLAWVLLVFGLIVALYTPVLIGPMLMGDRADLLRVVDLLPQTRQPELAQLLQPVTETRYCK